MFTLIRASVVMFVFFTLVTGGIYPAIVTGIAKAAFKDQAKGSVIERDGKAVGSSLISQSFTDPKYFWSRPSAANYDATASSGSNLGPSNQALVDAVKSRVAALQAADPGNTAAVPVDLVTASGSGLDPQISVEAATYQLARVARARGLGESAVTDLVKQNTAGRTLGIMGEPRVNVLELNLMLDAAAAKR